MLDPDTTDRLRAALTAADFTADATYALLGDQAHRALGRNQVVPALRATTDRSPLATLVRLFTLQVQMPLDEVERALPGLVQPLAAAGMLQTAGGQVRASVDLRPYGDEDHDWWIVCDATPGLGQAVSAMDPQHVLGISEASSSLAQLVIRDEVDAALDLGTGCGVQALHLAQHARRVVATDVNPRALAMARLTAALNGVDIDVRDGSLFEPVGGERFDLIATNPPFVISPPGSEVLVYRDSGMPGDAVVRHLVERASEHLNPGGWCQILANWAHRSGSDWADDVGAWLQQSSDLDAWVLQREQVDPAEYVEMWLSDAGVTAGAEHTRRYDEWLAWFDAEGITGVGFGWLSLRRTDATPSLRLEEWTGEIAPPVGPSVARWGRVVDRLRAVEDEDLLDLHLQAATQVQQTRGRVGAEDPEQVVLQLQHGVRRTRQVDTVEAALVGACDGELSVGQILDAIGSLIDREDLRTTHLRAVRDLVTEGFLDLPPPR